MDNIKIRIFLSSTFNDSMVRTRDAFRNEMLARLNALAGQIQGNVYLNDFELGIPEGTVLSEYLAGTNWEETRYASLISRAIGYGFTVLELEFLCAVICGVKSFFYLSVDHIVSIDDSSIEKFLFMHCQSITGFTSVETLKRDMIEKMEAEWNLRYYFFSKYSKEEKDINIIMANKLRYHVPNPDCSRAISNYINSDSTQVLFITGQSGSGKSTAIFDWFNSNSETLDYHVLIFASEHISFSLDELLEQIFTTHTEKIANLWFYNRELLLKAFDLIKSSVLISKLKELAIKDKDSNSPFFISHLFFEYGYFKEAIDIYECILSGSRRAELSDSDLATVFNNLGLNLCNYGEKKAGERNLFLAIIFQHSIWIMMSSKKRPNIWMKQLKYVKLVFGKTALNK